MASQAGKGLRFCREQSELITQCFTPGMHGLGLGAGAPASDAAGRGDAAGMRQTARPCRVGPRRATWQGPNRADAG